MGPDQDAAEAGIPGIEDLVAAEQISGDHPGTTHYIDLRRRFGAAAMDHNNRQGRVTTLRREQNT